MQHKEKFSRFQKDRSDLRSWLYFILAAVLSSCATEKKPQTFEVTTSKISTESRAFLAPEKVLTRIAFGSCADQKKLAPIWTTIEQTKPDVFLFTGDTVYTSQAGSTIRKSYEAQAKGKSFESFQSKIPIFAIWDDHDYAMDDGGKSNPRFDEAKSNFLEFFPLDAALIPAAQRGLQHSMIVGAGEQTVQVIFLDTRSYRDDLEKNLNTKNPALDRYVPTQDRKKTLLGEGQWQWLKQELQQKARVRILVSSIQLIHQNHGLEKWGNFPHERSRLFDLLKSLKLKNTFVISGDRHQGEIHKQSLIGFGDLYDITSSGINKTSTIVSEPSPTRVGTHYRLENFGLIEINWKSKKLGVSLRDMDGQSINAVSMKIQ